MHNNIINTCKGVISCEDFLYMTDGEIVDGLAKYQCESVRKILRKPKTANPEDLPVQTRTLIATFKLPQIPQKVRLGFLSLEVRPYIPNPLRCFGCQRYGHSSRICRNPPVCGFCSLDEHAPEKCQQQIQCLNCKGSHPSWSRECKRFKEEQEIQKIKTLEKVSHFEARKMFNIQNPHVLSESTNTYAHFTKQPLHKQHNETEYPNRNIPDNTVTNLNKNVNTITTTNTNHNTNLKTHKDDTLKPKPYD